jgi:hypothetical protein
MSNPSANTLHRGTIGEHLHHESHLMIMNRPRRATAESIARVVSRAIPGVEIEQLRKSRFWIKEHGEPFAEVDVIDDGDAIHARFSAHCAPQWAAITCVALTKAGAPSGVAVHAGPFLVKSNGDVIYDDEADDHYQYLLRTQQIRKFKVAGKRPT